MRLIFFGTGTSQGVPIIACKCKVCTSTDKRDKRLRTSALIQTKGKNILIDAGPDFRQQMLREKIDDLNAILLTHAHIDHVGGLDDVRALNYVNKKPTDIYAEPLVQEALHKIFYYAFAEKKYPGVPEFNIHTIELKDFYVDDVRITPIRLIHYKMPIVGFRIGNLTYITDANHIPDEDWEKFEGTKVLVINALRKEKHLSHFCLSEALEVIKKVQPERAYLTHISHQMDLHADLQAILPPNVFAAYDGLQIEVED